MLKFCLIFSLIRLTFQKGYYRTEDLPLQKWENRVIQSKSNIKSKIECAAICETYENCNSFKLEGSTCHMADLGTLREFEADSIREPFYVVDQYFYVNCRGGDDCCKESNLCDWGEGDCDTDDQCFGSGLICGSKNCPHEKGGLWDEQDDCCAQRCTKNNPCNPGDGICTGDLGCVNPEFNICDLTEFCTNSTYFPKDQFPNNTDDNYKSYYHCCRRRCYSIDPCGLNGKGCLYDEDCLPGLVCNSSAICQDFDECQTDDAQNACGVNTNCINGDNSYVCECKPGFENYVMNFGCTDVDECFDVLYDCPDLSICQNTIGNYTCVCKNGYDGNPYTSCQDINECLTNDANECKNNSNCINKDGGYACACNPGFEGDPFTGCTDIDECKDFTYFCPINGSICENNDGGYDCVCPVDTQVTLKDCPYGAKLNLEQGYIQSPEFSTGGYTTAYICSWVITVPEGSKVALKFHSFELEEESEIYSKCYYDTVKVYDGGDSFAAELGTFCGNTIPEDIITTGNQLYLEFDTDSIDHFTGFFSSFTEVDQETPTFCKTIEDCSGGANLYEQVCEDDPGNCECIEMIPTK